MRISRFFWFLFMILLGVTGGLLFGWYVSPSPMGEVSPSSLRSDYRTDYVLMVAEIYDVEKDLGKASQRLEFLQGESPARLSQIAVIKAGELGYDSKDLELLARLAQAMLSSPDVATPTPGEAP